MRKHSCQHCEQDFRALVDAWKHEGRTGHIVLKRDGWS